MRKLLNGIPLTAVNSLHADRMAKRENYTSPILICMRTCAHLLMLTVRLALSVLQRNRRTISDAETFSRISKDANILPWPFDFPSSLRSLNSSQTPFYRFVAYLSFYQWDNRSLNWEFLLKRVWHVLTYDTHHFFPYDIWKTRVREFIWLRASKRVQTSSFFFSLLYFFFFIYLFLFLTDNKSLPFETGWFVS